MPVTGDAANRGEHAGPSGGIKGSELALELREHPVPLTLKIDQPEPMRSMEPHRVVEIVGQRGRLEERMKHPGCPIEVTLGREPSRNLTRERVAAKMNAALLSRSPAEVSEGRRSWGRESVRDGQPSTVPVHGIVV